MQYNGTPAFLAVVGILQLAVRRSSCRLTRTCPTSRHPQPTYQPTLAQPTVSPSDMYQPFDLNLTRRLACWLTLAMSAA